MISPRKRNYRSPTSFLTATFLVIAGICRLIQTSHSQPQVGVGSGQRQSAPFTVTGLIVAERQSSLSARIPARIVTVYARENEPVRRGQTLVQLDDSELLSQLRSARAALNGAVAQESKASAGKAAQQVKSDSDISTARHSVQDATSKCSQAMLGRDLAVSETVADLKAAQQSVQKATIALERAQKTLHDLETLDKVGGVSRNDLEGARVQVTLAQVDLDSSLWQESVG